MQAGDDKLSYAVIGQAMAVHRELGPGLDEFFYHQLLSEKLAVIGIKHEFKPKGQLKHRGIIADEFEADLIIEKQLVLELKALRGPLAAEHYAQLMCYQKFWKIRTGWLLDFGKESLIRKRVVFDSNVQPTVESHDFAQIDQQSQAGSTQLSAFIESLRLIYASYGLGYRDTSYRGLLSAELKAKNIPFQLNPEADLPSINHRLGRAALDCMKIGHQGAAIILALHENIRAADRAVMQTYIRLLAGAWGIIANFGKKQLDIKMLRSA